MNPNKLARFLESGELVMDATLANILWIPVAVLFFGGIAWLGDIGMKNYQKGLAYSAVQSIVARQTVLTSGAVATVYPPQTVGDAANGIPPQANAGCSTPGTWCVEKVIHTRSSSGDHYEGWETLSTGATSSEIVHFAATGITNTGSLQGVTILDRSTFASDAQPLMYGSVPATSIATDSRNPAAGVVGMYETAVGGAPVVRSIQWNSSPYDVGTNSLELDRVNAGPLQTTTGMAIATLPAQSVTVTATYTPTPLPASTVSSGSSLLFYWPQVSGAAGGVSSFSVQMPSYHEPFFAQASSCAVPNPSYSGAPGYASGSGSSGPWVYPNPNGTGSNSGPATFGISSVSQGLCSIEIYTAYTPFGGPAVAPEPTPFGPSVQVMGWLTLGWNGQTATSQTGPISIPSADLAQGAIITVSNRKGNDQFSVTPSIGSSTCPAGSISLANGSQNSGGTSSGTASGSFRLTVVSLPSVATGCTIGITDQYNEPVVAINLDLPAADGPLVTLGQVEFNASAVADIAPEQHIAQILNGLLGGGTADAGSTSCSYAQLWLQTGVVDANGADGFNQTDSNGCVTNGQVRLWATETGYSGQFSDSFTACQGYATISAYNWAVGSYATITPVAATSGCTFPVASTDRTVANGGAKNVTVIVDSIDALPCKPDSYGYCAVETANVESSLEPVDCDEADGTVIKAENVSSPGSTTYAVYSASGLLGAYTETIELKLVSCTNVTYDTPDGSYDWKPGDPASIYGDPDLP